MLTVTNLSRSFKGVRAVSDVSFEARDGQITGLLGSNGAGKTTTLRMICGLIVPDGGGVRVGEWDVARAKIQARMEIGMLPDSRGLYPRLTGRENVEYFGNLRGLSSAEVTSRLRPITEELQMEELLDRKVEGFSQGERAKIAFSRAIIHQPRHVLLDEPTNGLDVMSTRAMRRLIRRLRAEGKCVVFSSHIMQEVSALCDVIVIISHGEVVARGTEEELLAMTKTTTLEDAFVALSVKEEKA
ncbi:MAG: ATP-binding cassette domain-containing protein [Nannocystaceae bacterium]